MVRWSVAVLVVFAAAVAYVWWRESRSRAPARGDIWWADVPFARGRGAKLRPCLVLLPRPGGAVVLKITSQDKSHRRDHVRIPTRRWDRHADHDSYVNLGEPIMVRSDAFQRRAGRAAWSVRRQVGRRRNLARSRLEQLATGRRTG